MMCSDTVLPLAKITYGRYSTALVVLAALLSSSSAAGFAQSSSPTLSPQSGGTITLQGTVRNAAGEPVAGASVFLEEKGQSKPVKTVTSADGTFIFSPSRSGTYTLRAEKSGIGSAVIDSLVLSAAEKKQVNLVLQSLGHTHPGAAQSPSGEMEFEDKPNFTVAGVTDWTAAGGHGSDANLRTSETLAKETLALKSGASSEVSGPAFVGTRSENSDSEKKLRISLVQTPGSFEANHQLGEFYCHSERYREAIPLLEVASHINPADRANAFDLALAYRGNGDFARAHAQVQKMLASDDKAELHRLLGDINERMNDPLGAVREYEQAALLEPNEQNYFEWGTELLLHRAILPAVEVFRKGSGAHPDSARMLAGLGVALYASGSYGEAARQLCDASDLRPADPTPYIFLGKMEMAAPEPLPCVEQKLARFVHDQPGSALGNYYYATAIWRREKGSGNSAGWQQAVSLLEKAVSIDPKLDEAYLQLGILYSAKNENEQAVRDYKQAIEANPVLSEAYYRLGLAYKRTGDAEKAQQEFQLHEQVEKTQAAAIERQRRELQQFVVILKDQPAVPASR